MKNFRDSWDLEGQALSEIHVKAGDTSPVGYICGLVQYWKVGEREGTQ